MHEGRLLIQPRFKKVPNPGVGLDWTLKTDAGRLWIPLSIRATFTASAAVLSRNPTFQVGDGTDTFWSIGPAGTQTANQADTYNALRVLGSSTQAGNLGVCNLPLPNIPIIGGQVISSLTVNIDAGDAWTGISVYVLEVRERTPNERAQYMEDLELGRPTTDYPGLLLSL